MGFVGKIGSAGAPDLVVLLHHAKRRPRERGGTAGSREFQSRSLKTRGPSPGVMARIDPNTSTKSPRSKGVGPVFSDLISETGCRLAASRV